MADSNNVSVKVATWLVDRISKYLWGLPVVTTIAYGLWAYLRGPVGPEVFLGMLAAAMVAIVSVASIKGYAAIEAGTATLSDLKTLLTTSSPGNLAPKVEWLEEGRRAQAAKREGMISSWRHMVSELHEQMLSEPKPSLAFLLERHRSFYTFRPYMSARTRGVLFGREMLVSLDHSSMQGGLIAVLDDIDALAKQWSIE